MNMTMKPYNVKKNYYKTSIVLYWIASNDIENETGVELIVVPQKPNCGRRASKCELALSKNCIAFVELGLLNEHINSRDKEAPATTVHTEINKLQLNVSASLATR